MGLHFQTQPSVFTGGLSAKNIALYSESGRIVSLSSEDIDSNNITASNAFITSLTALSSIINVIDIKMYEMSGFDVTGDVDIDGNLTVIGRTALSGNLDTLNNVSVGDNLIVNKNIQSFSLGTTNANVSSLLVNTLTSQNVTTITLSANTGLTNNLFTTNANVSALLVNTLTSQNVIVDTLSASTGLTNNLFTINANVSSFYVIDIFGNTLNLTGLLSTNSNGLMGVDNLIYPGTNDAFVFGKGIKAGTSNFTYVNNLSVLDAIYAKQLIIENNNPEESVVGKLSALSGFASFGSSYFNGLTSKSIITDTLSAGTVLSNNLFNTNANISSLLVNTLTATEQIYTRNLSASNNIISNDLVTNTLSSLSADFNVIRVNANNDTTLPASIIYGLSSNNIFSNSIITNSLTALSATINIVDITLYELSGFNITGNTTVGGTLGITGNTTVGGTLGVTGRINASGDVSTNKIFNLANNEILDLSNSNKLVSRRDVEFRNSTNTGYANITASNITSTTSIFANSISATGAISTPVLSTTFIDLSSVKFTRELKTSITSVTATDFYIKVIVNSEDKYLRLFDVT